MPFEIRVVVQEYAHGITLPPMTLQVGKLPAKPPLLRLVRVHFDDRTGTHTAGNGDGKIQRAETVTVQAELTNAGEGIARGVRARIHAEAAPVRLVHTPTSFPLGDLVPQQTRMLSFAVHVSSTAAAAETLPLRLTVEEDSGQFGFEATIKLPLDHTRPAYYPPLADFAERAGAAVVIGTASYDHYPNDPVFFAERDQTTIAAEAEERLGFAEVFATQAATRDDYERLLGTAENPRGALYTALRNRDAVLIYVTGHGHSQPQPEAATRAFLVPKDGHLDHLEATAYPLDVLATNLAYLIEQKRPEKLILLFDLSFSSYLAQTVSGSAWPFENPLRKLEATSLRAGTSFAAVFAAEATETAKAHQPAQHGLLTFFLTHALHGTAPTPNHTPDHNADGTLTLGELRAFLTDPIHGLPAYAQQPDVTGPYANGSQTPIIWGDNQMVLWRYR